MSQLLNNAFNSESFRKHGHKLVDLLADYLDKCKDGDNNLPPLPWKAPDQLFEELDSLFPESTRNDPEAFFSTVIQHSLHLHHPKYMGHQVVPALPMAALVDFLSDFLNNSMAVYEVGPLSSAIEKKVLQWLASALGFGDQADGVLTSGGTIGNLTGLLAARQNMADYNIWEEGIKADPNLAVMVSAESHYSVARAIKIMGLGEKGIIKIPVNDKRQVIPEKLESCFIDATQQGKKVIAVVGNACSTSTGSYDPLEQMADFCKLHNLWFHIDGAHGGGAALTEKYKHLVRGIEKADSVVIDFHKMMLCPGLTTAVVFKNGNRSYETFSQKASYLLADQKKGNWFDIAERTLECTKKMMGVKVFALLKFYGPQLFSDYITRAYDLAKVFALLIKDSDDFQLAFEPESNIVCFRFSPPSFKTNQELNDLNKKIRELLKLDQEFYIVQTLIDESLYLRTTLMNPFTTKTELTLLLQKIRTLYANLPS